MKILNLEPYGYSQVAEKKIIDSGWQYMPIEWADAFDQQYRDAQALIVRLSKKIGASDLDHFPDLKYVLSATTGLDHIDLSALRQRGIRLISLRGERDFLEGISSTSEHTWALLLSLVRNIPAAVFDVAGGGWNRDTFRGYQLKNRRIGIIGLGRTGRKVASYADAFGMDVGYYDPYVISNEYFKFDNLEDLLRVSDVVSLHVHLNEETRNMLNEENISIIKKGAVLVNTSRGGLWDESYVTKALSDGILSGVATDVLTGELDDMKLSPLWQAVKEGKRVIITPHIGGATWDAMWCCEEFIADKFINATK